MALRLTTPSAATMQRNKRIWHLRSRYKRSRRIAKSGGHGLDLAIQAEHFVFSTSLRHG
jgi:hypothetical protein